MRIAVLGNPTIDEIQHGKRTRVLPGGSAFYVSAALASLGAKVAIVGNVGRDYPEEALRWLGRRGVETRSITRTDSPTTRFHLAYHDSSRRLRILSEGVSLRDSLSGHWDAVHLGPVFGEIKPTVGPYVRLHGKHISLDLQGFMRAASKTRSVQLSRKRLRLLLQNCTSVKASLEEAKIQTSTHTAPRAAEKLTAAGAEYGIVTLARRGAVLSVRNAESYWIPAYPVARVADPTGAGDGFVGGWLTSIVSTEDPLWSASVGSAFSSMMLGGYGTQKFRLSRETLFRRSAWVYRHVSPIG